MMTPAQKQVCGIAVLFAFAFVGALAVTSCKAGDVAPVAADVNSAVAYQAALEHCQAVGKDAGSYAAYEACKKEGGLK